MADGEGHHELIIVRRHEEDEHEHHSSAWKVAHADFMTAMMAFFLIMWLINVTDDQMRKGISQYFNPIHLSEGSTELKGLNAPSDDPEKAGNKKGHADQPGPAANDPSAFNPMKLSTGAADKGAADSAKQVVAAAEKAAAAAVAASTAPGNAKAGLGEAATSARATTAEASLPSAGEARERAAFQDPYAVLAQLAATYASTHPTSVDAVAADERPSGVVGGEIDRDPFDPVYWQMAPAPPARVDAPGKPGSAARAPADAIPDATAAPSLQVAAPAPAPATVVPDANTDKPQPLKALGPQPRMVDSVTATIREAREKDVAPATLAATKALDADLNRSMKALSTDASPAVSVKATAEGVVINLTDDAAYSMFPVGSAVPDAKLVVLMEKVAKTIAARQGDVVVRGFTDGRPFHSDSYDNWRLSAERAHMAYYMLVRGGLDETRVVAIEGHADRSPKNPADPNAAENRRIEILLKASGP
jgi:chemotaxis protein MotB